MILEDDSPIYPDGKTPFVEAHDSAAALGAAMLTFTFLLGVLVGLALARWT